MLDVLDAGDGSKSKCRTIGDGRVHFNVSVECQHGARATVKQWIVLQDFDSSFHGVQRGPTACKNVTPGFNSFSNPGNDCCFLVVRYGSDTAMNDDRIHWSSTLNMITYPASIWY